MSKKGREQAGMETEIIQEVSKDHLSKNIQYLAAFDRFMKMKIDVIIPGHGRAIWNPQE